MAGNGKRKLSLPLIFRYHTLVTLYLNIYSIDKSNCISEEVDSMLDRVGLEVQAILDRANLQVVAEVE
jgi:hypothetical protein